MSGSSKSGLSFFSVGAASAVVAALVALPANAVTMPSAGGTAAVGAAAEKAPTNTVKVTLHLKSATQTTARFVGDVTGGPKAGTVILQRRQGSGGKWRSVMSSDHTPRGFAISYASRPGRYRVVVPLRTWSNAARWSGPARVVSDTETLQRSVGAEKPIDWVVGMGDSYMSGEGASYAGYGPQGGTSHGYLQQTDLWWIDTFGRNLRETYPGDYRQPINQPGLTEEEVRDYDLPLYGVLCHRSASALMNWSAAGFASVNFACSGATAPTVVGKGKPGVDFTDENTQKMGRIVGQAKQLQDFATRVRQRGDRISVISLSIGGNDVNFSDIVSNCVKSYVMPGKDCAKDSGSDLSRAFDKGNGLTAAREAVKSAGTNIIKAMSNAGFQSGEYKILVQTYPIGVPPSDEFQSDFGGNHGFGRQGIGGCGFTDDSLDAVNGAFGDLLRTRTLQGAADLAEANKQASIRVVDAAGSADAHQLCSKKVDYPKTESDGSNSWPTPTWAGRFGGQHGAWITPIISCSEAWYTCDDSMPFSFPKLMRAMDCEGVDWGNIKPWTRCSNGDAYENVAQLPMHPNYWLQRGLAACHQWVATNGRDNQIVRCQPPASDNSSLDDLGRPPMRLVVSDEALNAFAPKTTDTPPRYLTPRRSQLFTEVVKGGRRLCLDAKGIDSSFAPDGTPVVVWPCKTAANQAVDIRADGTMRVLSKCIAAGGGVNRGADVVLWHCNGGAEQKVRLTDDARLKIGDKCIGVSENKFNDGQKLVLWDCLNQTGQMWNRSGITWP